MATTKTLPVSLRMAPELKTALIALAEADRRSFTAYVELVLEDHVKAKNPKLLKAKKG